MRPRLSYGDLICNQTLSVLFKTQINLVQYNTALEITGDTNSSSRDKLYQIIELPSASQYENT